MPFTNKGVALMFDSFFRDQNEPANFYLHLCTATDTPDADTNTLSDLTEVSSAGYSAQSYARNSTNFPTLSEDDASDFGGVISADVVFTASGGPITDARYLVLCDANATPGSRVVIAYFDLSVNRSVADTEDLTITAPAFRGSNA